MKDIYKFHTGVDGLIHSLYGLYKRTEFSTTRLRKDAVSVYDFSLASVGLDDEELVRKVRFNRRPSRNDVETVSAFYVMGLLCEVCFRTLKIRPYVEQIMGALAISRNVAIQMQTGEGKTITAAMSAVLAGWRGGPCHVVTSNDYLAKRDAETMRPLYECCGLSVGYVISGMEPQERRETYRRDIVYSTSKELLADYLRDRMWEDADSAISCEGIRTILASGASSGKVMRGLHTAIIDEADSVLIDEATVPLIIAVSGSSPLLNEAVRTAFAISEQLVAGKDYHLNLQAKYVTFTQTGIEVVATAAHKLPSAWKNSDRSEFLVKQAIIARFCYHRDVHYVVDQDKVVIVDEKTGRMMDGRSWSGGLHQAMEVKEFLENSDPTHAHIKMSFQMFFRLYDNLSGMSGTLQNVEKELWSVYSLPVINIPTHAPKKLVCHPEIVVGSYEEKWSAVIENITHHASKGRAVLVGVRSVRDSEALHGRLLASGIISTVLNALRHEEEARIIAGAGRWGQVTIATNMAGRGTDIVVDKDVLAAGGMHVIATERHESRRVDMQLFGRTARQGDPGSAQMIVSPDDEVIRLFTPLFLARTLKTLILSGRRTFFVVWWFQGVQFLAEKSISRVRKKLLQQDLALSKALSFTKF
ncbi:MAG: DEAD/DEAH box helicase [Desulfuromonadaceae bacterium]